MHANTPLKEEEPNQLHELKEKEVVGTRMPEVKQADPLPPLKEPENKNDSIPKENLSSDACLMKMDAPMKPVREKATPV